jgi:hypothetical protein
VNTAEWEYTPAMVDQQQRAWLDAVASVRRGDRHTASRLLAGDTTRSYRQYYAWLAAGAVLGAQLCAEAMVRQLGGIPARHAVAVVAREELVEPTAAEALAYRLVELASRGELDVVAQRVLAYSDPRSAGIGIEAGIGLLVDLQVELLLVFAALPDLPAAPGLRPQGGAR